MEVTLPRASCPVPRPPVQYPCRRDHGAVPTASFVSNSHTLLLGVGDLPIPFDHLFAEFLNLTPLLLDLPLQFIPAGRMGVRMPARRYLLVACAPGGSRIHPPYVKRFREICSAKSVGIPDKLPQNNGVNSYGKTIFTLSCRVSGIKPGKVDRKGEKAVGVILENLLLQVDPLTIIDGEPIADDNNLPAAGNDEEVQEIFG